jgi:hypothetical protein
MDRKMGIPSFKNGLSNPASKLLNSPPKIINGGVKRKQETSDSEEDSKSKLLIKSSLKKSAGNPSMQKPAKSEKVSARHEALTRSALPLHEASPIVSSSPVGPLPIVSDPSINPPLSPTNEVVLPAALRTPLPKPPELPTFDEILAENDMRIHKESEKDQRKSLKREQKRERKKERKRRKKLEKENSLLENPES